MELSSKIRILAAAAKYDASCASSGSNRVNTPGGLGNAETSGICHSWSDDGRCISLLKVLFTNECIYDCAYCVNRATSNIPRSSFTPEELADLTINFYRRNYIEGLFLSSSVKRSPDHTMELLLQTVKLLRNTYRFNGYIHLKAIPGADYRLVQEAGRYADRMSVNIELPSTSGLRLLAPQKKKTTIIKTMHSLNQDIMEYEEGYKLRSRQRIRFVPAGQSTQLIVGATPDTDLTIMRLSESLYSSYRLRRVYYSAFMPVSRDRRLQLLEKPPLLREHRLYQADWLLRFYGFQANELLDESNANLDLQFDPKADWALRHLDLFPVEVNTADYWMLLRVPGIGVKSAKKIVTARRVTALTFEDLRKIGCVLKRARFFITCQGKYLTKLNLDNDLLIRRQLLEPEEPANKNWDQLSLFPATPVVAHDHFSQVTGEL